MEMKHETEITPINLVNRVLSNLALESIITEMSETIYGREQGSLRNQLDSEVINSVQSAGTNPVTLMEIGPGGMKQALTITAALMQKNISVNWIFIDEAFVVEDVAFNGSRTNEKYEAFNQAVVGLKNELQTESNCKIIGKFCSCAGYYMRSKSEVCSSEEEAKKTYKKNLSLERVYLMDNGCSTGMPEAALGWIKYDSRQEIVNKQDLKPDMIVGFASPTNLASNVARKAFKYEDTPLKIIAGSATKKLITNESQYSCDPATTMAEMKISQQQLREEAKQSEPDQIPPGLH